MTNNKISIIGCGGHCISLQNILPEGYKVDIFDDNYCGKEKIGDYFLINKIEYIPKDSYIILGIGDIEKRLYYYNNYKIRLFNDNLKHKTSMIENQVYLGLYNQIFANTYINSFSKIGNNNIINTGAIIEHSVVIGNHNHISIGSKVAGNVKIGNMVFIGAGSTIINDIKICDKVIIAAHSVVITDIDTPGTYAGCPVKKVK